MKTLFEMIDRVDFVDGMDTEKTHLVGDVHSVYNVHSVHCLGASISERSRVGESDQMVVLLAFANDGSVCRAEALLRQLDVECVDSLVVQVEAAAFN